VIYAIFQNQVTISTEQKMDITYYITASVNSDMYIAIYALLATTGLPAPMGVSVKYVLMPDDPRPFFAIATSMQELNVSVPERYGLAYGESEVNDFILLNYGDFINIE
jgi:hypothetical protein